MNQKDLYRAFHELLDTLQALHDPGADAEVVQTLRMLMDLPSTNGRPITDIAEVSTRQEVRVCLRRSAN